MLLADNESPCPADLLAAIFEAYLGTADNYFLQPWQCVLFITNQFLILRFAFPRWGSGTKDHG